MPAKATPAKATQPKDKAKAAAVPEGTEPDVDAPSPDDAPAPDPADIQADNGGDDTPGPDEGDEEPQTGMAAEPCRKHFPDGWPVQEEGAYVNCPHDHGIRYGDQIEITRKRAVELGFLDEA